MNKIRNLVIKNKVLLFIILLALLLRLPWLYTTVGIDEGSFGYATWRMLSGDKLYTEIQENKSPLLYVLYAVPIYFFGNSIIPVRIFNDLLFIISIIFFFLLVEHLFTRKTAIFSTLFYITFMNVPMFGGYFALSESFLTPFLVISLYSLNKYISSRKTYLLFLSSVFAAVTVLIKQQAGFIYLILVASLFVYKEKNKSKKTLLIFFPFLLVIILIMLFVNKTAFLGFLQRTWYTITKSPFGFSSGYKNWEYNLLVLSQSGLLWWFSVIGIIKVLKHKLDRHNLFVVCWLFSALMFTIIPPAYGHYYMFLIPPLAILSGIGVIYTTELKPIKKFFIIFVAIILLLVTGCIVIKHYPNSDINMGPLHWRGASLESYEQQTMLIQYVKDVTGPKDKILIWGYEPSIYWISERKSLPKVIPLHCNIHLHSNLSWNQMEQGLFSKNLKVIIFLPGYPKICSGMKKEIFSGLLSDYNLMEIEGIEIYRKN